jgi:hypothetical protein
LRLKGVLSNNSSDDNSGFAVVEAEHSAKSAAPGNKTVIRNNSPASNESVAQSLIAKKTRREVSSEVFGTVKRCGSRIARRKCRPLTQCSCGLRPRPRGPFAGCIDDLSEGRRNLFEIPIQPLTARSDIRDLIRTISRDNPLWGAPRIHGELLKLGIDVAQSTVAKYMSRRHGPGSPGRQAFLRNHTAHIAGVDLFVVPTIGFKVLYGLVILRHERRRLAWTDVTANPTAEWIARQITEAFPWDEAPRYLIRDRDTSYGAAVTRRLRAMGIRDRPITPRSPW